MLRRPTGSGPRRGIQYPGADQIRPGGAARASGGNPASEGETEKFTSQLNDILLYMDKLNEVDTTGVEPVTHAIARENAFREDRVAASLPAEGSLAHAPAAGGGCFQVPR